MLDEELTRELKSNWKSLYKEKLDFDQLSNEELCYLL
jgi:hypothetical protein